MDLDTALVVLRVFAGLLIAGHGAQKALGWFGGPGLAGFGGMVDKMGFRPRDLWSNVAAWGELVGGLMLAVGLLTGLAAGILAVDMVVAIWKVHWARGLWISNGGYEHALTNLVVYGVFGLTGAGAYSVDAALRLASWTAALFLASIVVGLAMVWAGARPAAGAIERARADEGERRGRPAA